MKDLPVPGIPIICNAFWNLELAPKKAK